MKHVAIDIETLSTRRNAVILTIGAVAFDPHGPMLKPWRINEMMLLGSSSHMDQDQLHIRLDVGTQLAAGHSTELETLEWWMTQDERARAAAFADGVSAPVQMGLAWLSDFCRGAERFWAQGGLTFDFPILETAFDCAAMDTPWKYNALRDVRTLVDGHGESAYGFKHHALFDAFNEARWVQEHYRAQRPWYRRWFGGAS